MSFYCFYLNVKVVEEAYCCQIVCGGSSAMISGQRRKACPSSGLRSTIEGSRDSSLRPARLRSQNYWAAAARASLSPLAPSPPLSSLTSCSLPLIHTYYFSLSLFSLRSALPFFWFLVVKSDLFCLFSLSHGWLVSPISLPSLRTELGFIKFKCSVLTLSTRSSRCSANIGFI